MREYDERTGRLFYCGYRQQHEALPLADKYLSGKRLTYQEKTRLLTAFDLSGRITDYCRFGPHYNPDRFAEKFELWRDEITALVMHWKNVLEAPEPVNILTISYSIPPGFDPAPFTLAEQAQRMEWGDVFERAEKWEELARDMAALLERENVRHYESMIERMERMP